MEIESALVAHPKVAEAAVVGKPHEIKGEAVFAYVVCRGTRPAGDTSALVKELRDWVAEQLGAIARPEELRFADNLPKTRSGKIMRRLLRSIARGEEILQDVSTLENPAILDQLRGVAPGAGSGQAAPSVPSTGARSARRTPAIRTGAKVNRRGKNRRGKTPRGKSPRGKTLRTKTRRARSSAATTGVAKTRGAKTRGAKTNRNRARVAKAGTHAQAGGLRRRAATKTAARKRHTSSPRRVRR